MTDLEVVPDDDDVHSADDLPARRFDMSAVVRQTVKDQLREVEGRLRMIRVLLDTLDP